MEDRHGGIGSFALRDGESVALEHHDADRDELQWVVHRADGAVQVTLLRKAQDWQWRLPNWVAYASATVATVEEAQRYIEAAGHCRGGR